MEMIDSLLLIILAGFGIFAAYLVSPSSDKKLKEIEEKDKELQITQEELRSAILQIDQNIKELKKQRQQELKSRKNKKDLDSQASKLKKDLK